MSLYDHTTSGGAVNEDAAEIVVTVAVYAAPDRMTAEVVRGALEGEGIYAVIGEQVADAYAGALAVGESFWGEVRVRADQETEARAVLADFDSGARSASGVSDAELTAQAETASDPEV